MAPVDSIPVPRPRTLRSYGHKYSTQMDFPIVVPIALIFEPVIGGAIDGVNRRGLYRNMDIGGPLMLVGAIMSPWKRVEIRKIQTRIHELPACRTHVNKAHLLVTNDDGIDADD